MRQVDDVGNRVMHAALWLRGRLVVAVAACWAVATMMMVTSFVILLRVAPSTWSKVEVAQAGALALSACALSVLAWQIVRRRLALGAQLITRGLAGLGVVFAAVSHGVFSFVRPHRGQPSQRA